MLKRTVITLIAACASVFAGDISISLPSSENLGEKISFLKDLRENANLDATQQKDFNDLWTQANNVATMNNRCGSILLNDIPDEACQHFYEVELPAFEAKFFELTGEFKLNAVKASNTLSDKRAMIEACAAALTPETYQVSPIFSRPSRPASASRISPSATSGMPFVRRTLLSAACTSTIATSPSGMSSSINDRMPSC